MNNNLVSEDFIGIGNPHSRHNVVKICFCSNYVYNNSNKKNLRLKICVGSDIARTLFWKNNDYINKDHFYLYLIVG